MKKILSLLTLLCVSFYCSSQDAKPTHMVGVNATSFVKSFLSFNDQNPSGSPYNFTYRRINGINRAFRAHIGLNFSTSTAEVTDDDDKTALTFANVQLGLGRERRFDLSKRWLMYCGTDLLCGIEQTIVKNTSGNETSTDQEQEITAGLSILGGIQFNITDRLSLSTEAGLPLLYTMNTRKFDASSETQKLQTTSIRLAPVLPTFLFFNYTF